MDEVVEAFEKYKGLVPLVYDTETMSLDEARSEDMQYAVYLKREADKVIAEKDAEIERLKAIRKVHVEAIESMGAGLLQDEEELRHQKYKRCLAMADKCVDLCHKAKDLYHWAEDENLEHHYNHKIEFFARWHNRWLEIAKQFKESK